MFGTSNTQEDSGLLSSIEKIEDRQKNPQGLGIILNAKAELELMASGQPLRSVVSMLSRAESYIHQKNDNGYASSEARKAADQCLNWILENSSNAKGVEKVVRFLGEVEKASKARTKSRRSTNRNSYRHDYHGRLVEKTITILQTELHGANDDQVNPLGKAEVKKLLNEKLQGEKIDGIAISSYATAWALAGQTEDENSPLWQYSNKKYHPVKSQL